jgi:tryptophan halogenase
MNTPLEVVIVGGGTAGWMTAAGLIRLMNVESCKIKLIESDNIGTIGVGEALLPQIKAFNDLIGINEAEMMHRTNATFKLGIDFVNWDYQGSSYLHPFGAYGQDIGGVSFHHQWLRAKQNGLAAPLEQYSFAVSACRNNKFNFPNSDKNSVSSTFDYAYHFDAGRYAQLLREVSEKAGVVRTEGEIVDVEQHHQSGNIESLTLKSGENIKGDLFIDCSGFKALLMNQMSESCFEDWSRWLLCDSAFAVASERLDSLPPYTRITAHKAGWQWCIPLQNRTGNGTVFSSQYMDKNEALECFMANLPSKAISEPNLLNFKPGRRLKSWSKNCIAIGLSSGFLEPLESTSIYLIQVAVMNLVKLFPTPPKNTVNLIDVELAREFNRLMDVEYSRIRDFLILHYHANRREEDEMWRYCREMALPDSLQETIALFKHRGYINEYKDGLFNLQSWFSVFTGQDIEAENFSPLANRMPLQKMTSELANFNDKVQQAVLEMPDHNHFIDTIRRKSV